MSNSLRGKKRTESKESEKMVSAVKWPSNCRESLKQVGM